MSLGFFNDSINFNPRSPHGERPGEVEALARDKQISTHAPRTGSDQNGNTHAL